MIQRNNMFRFKLSRSALLIGCSLGLIFSIWLSKNVRDDRRIVSQKEVISCDIIKVNDSTIIFKDGTYVLVIPSKVK